LGTRGSGNFFCLFFSLEVIKIRGKAIIDFDIDYDQKSVLLTERKQKLKRIIFKACRKCGETKPALKFSIDKRNRNGIGNICKACLNLASLDYYYLNREKRLAVVKQYDKEHKEQKRLYSENYRENHSEHLQKEAKIYYRKNRKRIKKRDLKRRGGKRDDQEIHPKGCRLVLI